MKVLILLAVVCVVRCSVIPVAVGETGTSAQFRSEDNLGNYNFGYNEDHTSGGTFRRESGDAHGNVAGSYGLRDADGRVRIVNYIANDDGFKADIQTNEPGVEPKDPADATINKAESVIVQTAIPLATFAEPIVAIPAEVAPVHSAPLFPALAAPVAKSHAITYDFPPVSAPVAKSVSTVITSESKPAAIAYTFPEPAAIPVAKSIAAPAPVLLSAPAPVAIAQHAPLSYAFPAPSAVPVAKSISAPAPVLLSAPAPVAVAQHAPLSYAFPAPAAVPVAKSISAPAPVLLSAPAQVAFAEPAPLRYAFPAPAAVPVAKSLAVAPAAPLLHAAPTSKLSYSSQVVVNNAPGVYGYHNAPVAVSPYHNAFRYASPYYRSLYSPIVSTFAGPVPHFSNIEYHGYPVVKK